VAGGLSLEPGTKGSSHCGFVALLGAPNAGKSTLLNRLVGAKVSIVSHKVQTTRMRVRGVVVDGDTQIVFVDTPGIFAPRRRLDRAMVDAAWQGAAEADALVVLIDTARGIDDDATRVLDGLRASGRRAFAALNKIDLVRRENLLALAAALDASGTIDRVFMISALTGDGVDDLRVALAGRMPPGPFLYPPDQLSDLPMRLLAAEITREAVYHRVHQELPYESTVETESWQQRRDGSVRIDQIVYVQRDGQKAIVLGKAGHTIKQIGSAARAEMETAFGHRVHLFLRVKVRERWMDEPERYRAVGLDFPKG
jgi:GTP-binding protein Era